jgi:hypothetical protein
MILMPVVEFQTTVLLSKNVWEIIVPSGDHLTDHDVALCPSDLLHTGERSPRLPAAFTCGPVDRRTIANAVRMSTLRVVPLKSATSS